jgi:hypothetical protein
MKLLGIYIDSAEADRVCGLLEEKGILVFRERPEPRSGLQDAVFVCLDSQLDDAQAVLRDPSYEPAQPIDVAQYRQDLVSDGMKSVFNYLFVPSLIIIAVCVLLVAAMNFINTPVL